MKILIITLLLLSSTVANGQSFLIEFNNSSGILVTVPDRTNDSIVNTANKVITIRGKELQAKQLIVENDSIFLIHYFDIDTTNNLPSYPIPEYLGLKHVLDPNDSLFKGKNFYYIKDSIFF